MGKETGIQWTDATWNPWRGCRKISPGCDNCYMFRDQIRYGKNPEEVVRAAKATFNSPLKWKDPKIIFTCSWSDFFHPKADPWRDEAWDIIKQTPHHQYQILTKRIIGINQTLTKDRLPWGWPLDNVWMGVSVENKKAVDRMRLLRYIPAKIKFLSIEPLLEDLGELYLSGIDWVICGGESGTGARKMEADWARNIRDQTKSAGIPFFFKQWGEYNLNGIKVGRVAAGNILDGEFWNEMPKVANARNV